MFQKIMFLLLTSLTTFIFTSDQTASHQQTPWFENIEIAQRHRYLTITCLCSPNTSHLESFLDFEQTSTGHLVAIHVHKGKETQRQMLGHFPELTLCAHQAVTDWYGEHRKEPVTLLITVPFDKKVIERAKQ